MKIAFFVAAGVMILVALAVLLLPLIRHGRATARPRSTFVLSLLIAFLLPLAAAGLYFMIGTPMALNPDAAGDDHPLTLDQAIAELRTHLTEQPDDVQGWMLLAQTNSMQQDPLAARDAYDHVLKLAPNNVDAMIGWAESDSTSRDNHLIEGRAQDLLKRAAKLQPDSQRALWLLGISDFQHARYREAASTWRLLQPQLEPGSKVAQSVADQIAIADARAGDAPAHATSSKPPAAVVHGASLQVQVALAPALKGKLKPGDVVFVYARAPDGPPMPLAVARLDASQLPTTLTLSDAMAMTPAMKLSSVPRVFVGARISHSGEPIAQAGDLEGDAGVVNVDDSATIKITIDKVH